MSLQEELMDRGTNTSGKRREREFEEVESRPGMLVGVCVGCPGISGAEAPPCGLKLWGKILPVPPLADGKALPVEKAWEMREAPRIIAGS